MFFFRKIYQQINLIFYYCLSKNFESLREFFVGQKIDCIKISAAASKFEKRLRNSLEAKFRNVRDESVGPGQGCPLLMNLIMNRISFVTSYAKLSYRTGYQIILGYLGHYEWELIGKLWRNSLVDVLVDGGVGEGHRKIFLKLIRWSVI